MPQERDRPAARPVRDAAGGRWCGSRAATRSCSGAAARRRSCCARPGSRTRSCPGSPPGIAAPAYAGIPVTHRELSSGVAFVTGHEDPGQTALDWPALAAFPGTLVFYMGVRALPRIAERLVAGGRPSDEPVAVVERGTLPGQRTVVATLADVAERAAGSPRAGDHARRARRGAARADRLARVAAAARAHRRGHPRAGAGQRARRAPARPRRRRRRGAGDPHAAARGRRSPTRAATTCCA